MKLPVLLLLFTLLFTAVSCGSCELSSLPFVQGFLRTQNDELVIMSFNAQNLFDAVHDGNEYAEYIPGSGRWGIEEYYGKLRTVADVIRQVSGGHGPDVVALQEIEKPAVLEMLAKEFLGDLGYRFSYLAYRHGQSVHVGVLSRISVTDIRCHASSENGRYILEIGLAPEAGKDRDLPLTLFINHWKSKREGTALTEGERYEAARLLVHRMSMLDNPFMICGDLNWNTEELESFPGKYGLDETDEIPALGIPGSFSPIWLSRDATELQSDSPVWHLYDPWGMSSLPGSYFYDGEWTAIDHFLVSRGLVDKSSWSVLSFDVFVTDTQCNADGRPLAYQPRTQTGCSDHFPVVLTLGLPESF